MRRSGAAWLAAASALLWLAAPGGCALLLDYDDYGDAPSASGGGGEGGEAPCEPGSSIACYTGGPGTRDVGLCVGGTKTCNPDGLGYGPCLGEITPAAAEVCVNASDEDCDGWTCAEPQWAQRFGAGTDQVVFGLAADQDHDSIVVSGWFTGDLDFGGTQLARDPLDGADLFVAELDSAGTPLWAYQGGDPSVKQTALGAAVNTTGRVAITGFRQAGDDTPEVGFVMRFNNRMPAVATFAATDQTRGVAVAMDDSQDSTYVAASFRGSFTIGAETVANDPPTTSNILLIKYGPNLSTPNPPSFGWVRGIGGSKDDEPLAMTLSPAEELLVTGRYRGVMEFNPAQHPGVNPLPDAGNASDIFVMKLSKDGAVLWARGLVAEPDTADAQGWAIASDPAGNVLVTGAMFGSTYFAGEQSPPWESGGGHDAFIAKFSPAGVLLWAKTFGGPGEQEGTGIDCEPNGDIYLSGAFQTAIDLDPGAPGGELTSAGTGDMFLAKLDASGKHIWSARFAKSGEGGLRFIRVGVLNEQPFLAGSWDGDLDFGTPRGELPSGGDGSADVFVAKFGRTTPPPP